MDFFITGDKHGDFGFLFRNCWDVLGNNTNAIILLGDAGINYYLNKKDDYIKESLNSVGCRWYLVRGNHEARPQHLETIKKEYDADVDGFIWYQPEYPNIRYFEDYGIYSLNGRKAAVIGGAYSVDKYYRLERKWAWFSDEELSDEEMDECEKLMTGQHFDFVLTHTCPLVYEPTDLFLSYVDQSSVSNRMEKFLDKLKDKFYWDHWLFGHFHADRIEAPFVEQFYQDIESLDRITDRWIRYSETGELDWWLKKSPHYL